MSGRPPAPSVPEGWLAKFDERYNTYYYVDTATGKSQWEKPAGAMGGDAPPPYVANSTDPKAMPQQAGYAGGYPQQQMYPQQGGYPQQQPYYPQQQMYPQQGGYYPQQPYYPQQQPVYVQQQQDSRRKGGMGMGTGLAMGAAGGLLGGMLISDMMTPDYMPPPGGDFGGGDFGGGDFGGGDF